jgi:hypothetical protein
VASNTCSAVPLIVPFAMPETRVCKHFCKHLRPLILDQSYALFVFGQMTLYDAQRNSCFDTAQRWVTHHATAMIERSGTSSE